MQPEAFVSAQDVEGLHHGAGFGGIAGLQEDLGEAHVTCVEVLGHLKFEAVVLIFTAQNVGEGMLVRQPNDGVEGAHGADALWRAEELLFVGEPELDFGSGETALCYRIGWGEIELFSIVFVAVAEGDESLEMTGKARRETDVVTIAAGADVLVEGVFVIDLRKR